METMLKNAGRICKGCQIDLLMYNNGKPLYMKCALNANYKGEKVI